MEDWEVYQFAVEFFCEYYQHHSSPSGEISEGWGLVLGVINVSSMKTQVKSLK